MVDLIGFLLKYKYAIIFYVVIILLLILKRKKLEIQSKIIVLYKMKWGLRWMDKYSAKFREWIILLGYIGVGAGFVGLVFISYLLIKNIINLFTVPGAVSGVSLVLPGINVPGLGVLPFWYWLIGIFLIAIIHEFSHGIVARAHNIEVKNTGIVFLGPIIGAFVEPNEKKLVKEKDIKQYSVLAAGSFSNIILAIFALLLLNLVFSPLQASMVQQDGFTFDAYYGENYPFAQEKIPAGTVINGIDNKEITNFQEFDTELSCKAPGQKIVVNTPGEDYAVTLGQNPDDARKPFLGIKSVRNEFAVKEKYQTGIWSVVYYLVDSLSSFLRWLFLLSLGIGLFNLLPLPIVDGGRMAQVFLHKWKGQEKGEKAYRRIGLFFLLILLLNLFLPLILKLL